MHSHMAFQFLVVSYVLYGTQLVQHSGIAHSVSQLTTRVRRGVGRSAHISLGTAPSKAFPERPIKSDAQKCIEIVWAFETDEDKKGHSTIACTH